jgi:DNA-binding IclR family transcriptional regulator
VESICLREKVASKQVLRQDQSIGNRIKVSTTGFGRAILVFLSERELKKQLSAELLEPHSVNSPNFLQ